MDAASWATRLLRANRESLARWQVQQARVCRLTFAPRGRAFHAGSALWATRTESGVGASHTARSQTSAGLALGLVLAAGLAYGLGTPIRSALAEAPNEPPAKERLIRLHEVHEHNRSSDTYWVFRGDRVYDVTDWVPNHPGGEVILRAVGGSLEPYWNIFTIHQKQDVYDILEQYFIGKIDPRDLVDGKAPTGQVEDPFKNDPERDAALIQHSARPCNSETPESELGSYITPTEKFYVRNHLWVPDVHDADTHRLTIELFDGEEVEYTVADLRKKFKEYSITATLQCSGNRRSHMTQASRPTNGLQWGVGAISTATWTGVRLRDVLADAGVNVQEPDEDIKHLKFVGAEAYGASIPIDKAIDRHGDVLLVYSMNAQPLPRDHGFPLRALVPGHVAARSVKWLSKIVLSDEESTSQWQRRDYKCFGPNVGASHPDWNTAPAIQETPVQSAITAVRQVKADRLEDNNLARVYGLEEDSVVLEGYAFAGGGRHIVRVDVSPDRGRTWMQAQLLENGAKVGASGSPDDHRAWAWKQWRVAVPSTQVSGKFCVKATDDSYNVQPDTFEPTYNFRGNLANAWHRVPVSRDDKPT
ncbi:hypothetical protein LTR36_009012 [Oleoguttula mirabilis]|uniref:Nitrate reductase [NADPH] n=1 Tax=Oleoguttula mirabilis TaxID=1507867 RepID=A0AAV9J6S9_9PEZI|nr:hypothetical protein LTR36_009012 [Oleoguttula mirabilis]